MNKKLALAMEYVELRKKFDEESFNKSANNPFELVRMFKIVDLQDKIEAIKRAIADKEKRIRREQYFATEVGAREKARLETAVEDAINKIKDLSVHTEDIIREQIINLVGDAFDCMFTGSLDNCWLEIGLRNTDSESMFKYKFGHKFEIKYYSRPFDGDEPEISANYGTLGSFDIINDMDHLNYLSALATILNNKSFKSFLILTFTSFLADYKKYDAEFTVAENNLRNFEVPE